MTARPTCKILIVEDEALVALEMEDTLRDAGYEVIGTADELGATMRLAAAGRPDLALCDVRLGAGSGIDVARALAGIGVPSMFVTGNCPESIREDTGFACLHKPFDDRRLLGAVAVADAVLHGRALPPLPANMHIFANASDNQSQ